MKSALNAQIKLRMVELTEYAKLVSWGWDPAVLASLDRLAAERSLQELRQQVVKGHSNPLRERRRQAALARARAR